MKAKIKATGETYEIVNVFELDVLLSDGSVYDYSKLVYIDQPDWQQARINAAIAAMQGMIVSDAYANTEIANSYTGEKKRVKWDENKIAKAAVAYADALVAELQKKDDNADVQQ